MAVASREYYYDEYRGGSVSRTPPLNVANLVAERSGSYAYAAEPISEPYPEPIIRPYIVPERPRRVPQKPRETENSNVRRFRYTYITAREKAFIVAVILVCSTVLLGIIMLSSYHAYMQNEVNITKAQTASVQKDIDELKVAIEKGNNIGTIENKAITELGMKYPGAKQIVYLDDVSGATGDEH